MAYNLGTLTTTVRNRIKDTTFDGDLIADYLNDTQREVLQRHRYPFMEVADTEALTAGTTDAQLYNDIDVVISLSLVDASDNVVRPTYIPYREFYEEYDPDTASAVQPSAYTIFGDTLVWNAPLDKAYTLQIKYLKTPTVLSLDVDEPDIPERFQEILIRGAQGRVEEYRDNYDIAALHQRKVEELTEDMIYRLATRQLTSLPKAKFGGR